MIYDKVLNFCKANDITVTEFEKTNNFGNGTVGKWLKFNPRLETLQKLASIMNTTVDELLKNDT